MRVEGTRSFAAARETVWDVLNDPRRMAEVMPGVESFDVENEARWKANVKIPLGLGGLRMAINFEKTEQRPPEFARLHAKGTGVGALMDMDTQFELLEQAGGTAMRWSADVRIAGPVGSMGQRVLQPIVNQQVQSVLNAIDEQVIAARGGAPSGAASPAADVPAAAKAGFVMGATPTRTADDLLAADADSGIGETGGSYGPDEGAAGTPPPSTDAPAFTKPEFYAGAEPSRDPPEPVAWQPEGSRPDPDLAGPPADADAEADAAAVEGTSGADEGLNPWAPESYSGDPQGPTQSTEDTGRA